MKLTERQYLEIWEGFASDIKNSTPVDKTESPKARKERIKKLEAVPETWFKYYFPKYAYSEPAPFHKAATRRVLNNPEWYEVRQWARELAKSTRTMMEVLYLVLTGRKRNVLLFSSSNDNAEKLLAPYKANLEFNNRIINDYGVQEKPGSWESADFTTRSGASFKAFGAGNNPRGTRNEEWRPDVLLFDDMDTDEQCRNPEQVQKKWKWIEDAAIGTRSISRPTLILFCGNKIAKLCCVSIAEKFADEVDRVNIRDKDGRSTWPTKNSEAHIDRVLSQKSYASQQREYFNNPITEGTIFKEMHYKKCRPLHDYEYLVCYTDPSYKAGKRNDYKATVLVGKWRGEYHVIKAFVQQTTTAKMIDWHYDIMALVGTNSCYYYMENVFLQDTILKEFYDRATVTGITVPIKGDERVKPDKLTRIESLLDPLNRNGKLFLNESERDNPNILTLADQFLALGPGNNAHDDAPDAVEGAVWILNTKEMTAANGAVERIKRKPNPKRM